MRTERPPRTLDDPRNVRDGDNPQINAAIEAKVQELVEQRLTAAVQEATAPLQNAIDRLTQNRDSILREKRQIELAALKETEDREAARPKFVAITREQARDPQAYRRAKAEAEKLGVDVQFVDPARTEDRGEPPPTFVTDTSFYFYTKAATGDHNAYKRAKVEAERRGLRFIVAQKPEHFPKEAFGTGGGE